MTTRGNSVRGNSVRGSSVSWPVAAVVVAGAAVVLAGGLIAWLHPAQLLPSGTVVSDGVRIYGARMAARALPLGVALILLLALRARRMLAALLVLVAAVEVGDAASALAYRDWAELAGAVVVAAAFAWSALRLNRSGTVPG
jgi:hypothetical protein